ncbi:MAG: tetratricopeptide repeat protein [Spirochaetaceae bacterium]|jgi:tetratricopeptide (TPR) repeat protein|nr:tetratricopeptide repeat protein [Spirochaetaceae bacterium]
MKKITLFVVFIGALLGSLGWLSACSSQERAAKAEEYYSLGMAYFELNRYEEAERWLNLAKSVDKTRAASEYNLGRIAYETGRFEEALGLFEGILRKDPDNLMALKAAAYCRIRLGGFEEAEALYARVLALVPEAVDNGYNYALVLYALERPEEAEAVLNKYPFALEENKDMQLLYARSQRAQHKPEAVDSYQRRLAGESNPQVQYEFAEVLEENTLYARALETYRSLLTAIPADQGEDAPGPRSAQVRFRIARLIFIADPGNSEALTELRTALEAGYTGEEGKGDDVESLLEDERISAADKEGIRGLIKELESAAGEAAEEGGSGADNARE